MKDFAGKAFIRIFAARQLTFIIMKSLKEWYEQDYLPMKTDANRNDSGNEVSLVDINRSEKVASLMKDSFERPKFIEISNDVHCFL